MTVTLLFVDDEASILSALKRLFRSSGYRILTAENGAEGLEILAQEAVDLVISDMRMPSMNGAQFLEQVRRNWPDTMRILLTGYADIGSTIDAINKGQIYCYISKPWEDSDIVLTVRQALERRALEHEKARLEALTSRQNEELKELNSNLEGQVQERTKEVRQTMESLKVAHEQLEVAHERLKKGFIASIRAFSSLIEMRGGGVLAGHAKRVGENTRKLAQQLGMSGVEVQDVVFATLLKDLGKISLPDRLLSKPLAALDTEEMALVTKHPIQGQAALMSLEQLENAAKLVRHQHEHFNGGGYPDRLAGFEIPLGARILAVAADYDALQMGILQPKRLSTSESLAYLVGSRNRRYDPVVIEAFVNLLNVAPAKPVGREMKVATAQLKDGMIIARDLLAKDGILLLSRGHALNEKVIDLLCGYERSMGDSLNVYIQLG